MRAHGYSVTFGILALIGLAVNPPITGCFVNPFFYVFAACAGLGLVAGLAGLAGAANGEDRGLAIAGIILSVASPFVGRAVAGPGSGGRGPEGAILGDIRTVISGQEAYKSANGGYHGTLECLSHPSACIPEYPQAAPTFLDSTLASGQPKSGYNRTFFAGPAAKGRSASSMSSFVYIAVPTTPRYSGVRGFCGDWEGMICFTIKGEMPQVKDGRCVTNVQDPKALCVPLR